VSAWISVLSRLTAAVAILAVLAGPASAQRRPGMRGQDRAELESRIRARFGQMVRERLGLDREQAARLDEVVGSFQSERMRLAREGQAVRRRMEALALERRTDDTEARELLERLRALRLEEAQLFQDEQEKLLEVLSPSQLLAFQMLREEMAQRIRRLRGIGPGPRPPGRPPGEFPPGYG
jgi:Spy/CpxP family protein refolding chaperone